MVTHMHSHTHAHAYMDTHIHTPDTDTHTLQHPKLVHKHFLSMYVVMHDMLSLSLHSVAYTQLNTHTHNHTHVQGACAAQHCTCTHTQKRACTQKHTHTPHTHTHTHAHTRARARICTHTAICNLTAPTLAHAPVLCSIRQTQTATHTLHRTPGRHNIHMLLHMYL